MISSGWVVLVLILYYLRKYEAHGQPWVSDFLAKEYFVYYEDDGNGSTLSPEQLAELVTPSLSEAQIERGEDDLEFNFLASLYDFGTESPEGEVEFIDTENSWNFGYDSIVYAMGIRGIGIDGKVYRDAACMGVLIHARVVMTLCSCVNSWYRSYRNVAPGEATDDMFKISSTSDSLIDIRAPNLVAHRNTWSGYVNRTGQMNFFTISRQVIEYQKCTQAVDAVDYEEMVKQFGTVAFLRLASSAAEHPAGPKERVFDPFYHEKKYPPDHNPDAFYDVTKEKLAFDAPSGFGRKGWKYNVYSYYQEVQPITPTDITKTKLENEEVVAYYPSQTTKEPLPGVFTFAERVDLANLLMGCQFEQKTPFQTYYKTYTGKKYECWYEFMFGSYYEASVEPKVNDNYTKAMEDYLYRTHHLACLVRTNNIKLCGFVPGSPVIHNGKIVGLLMTTFPDCLEFENLQKYFEISSVAVLAVLFTLKSELEPDAIGYDVYQDILNVIFAINDKLKEDELADDIEVTANYLLGFMNYPLTVSGKKKKKKKYIEELATIVYPSPHEELEEPIIDFVGHMDAEIRPIARTVLKNDKELKLSASLPVKDNPREKHRTNSMAAWVSPVIFPTTITVAAGLFSI